MKLRASAAVKGNNINKVIFVSQVAKMQLKFKSEVFKLDSKPSLIFPI